MNIKIFEPCEVITTTRYYPQFVTCKNAIYFFDGYHQTMELQAQGNSLNMISKQILLHS